MIWVAAIGGAVVGGGAVFAWFMWAFKDVYS